MMTGEDVENHWALLAQTMDTLLNLNPGEYPPISYEQTYSAVYKCVCHGFGEALYFRLLGEMERQLRSFSERLQAASDDQLVEAFNDTWLHFHSGLGGIVPIFNYLARFYVEAKLNLNLRAELVKIFDKMVLQSIYDRLFHQLRLAQNSAFLIQPATMESVIRALYKIRPNTVAEVPDLYRRFIPELVQHVHVEELPDLRDEARRMVAEARTGFDNEQQQQQNSQCRPLIVGGENYRTDNNVISLSDAPMDFQMDEDLPDAGAAGISDPPSAYNSEQQRRVKRKRNEADHECDEDISETTHHHTDPDEPSPSPRSLANRLPSTPSGASTSGGPARKHFHPDGESE